jgi:hypothetical protein
MGSITIDPASDEAQAATVVARRLLTARMAASAELDDPEAPSDPSGQQLWDEESGAAARYVVDGIGVATQHDADVLARRLATLLWALLDGSYDLVTSAVTLGRARHGNGGAPLTEDANLAIMEVARLAFHPDMPDDAID